jgi:hypothetical protein
MTRYLTAAIGPFLGGSFPVKRPRKTQPDDPGLNEKLYRDRSGSAVHFPTQWPSQQAVGTRERICLTCINSASAVRFRGKSVWDLESNGRCTHALRTRHA